MFCSNAAGLEIATLGLVWKVSPPTQEMFSSPNRLLERHLFEPVKRIMVDESPHGPVLRDGLTGQLHIGAQLHPLDISERGRVHNHEAFLGSRGRPFDPVTNPGTSFPTLE